MTSLSPEQFVEQYGRYFNANRVGAIAGLGLLFVEGPADGVCFEDSAGRKYLDMWCMGGTFSLGHRHPKVLAVAHEALAEEDFGSLFFFSEAKGQLGEKSPSSPTSPRSATAMPTISPRRSASARPPWCSWSRRAGASTS